MSTYTYHEDAAHGWLQVPVAELIKLNIADKITPYSYRKDDDAYLEEDLDMGTFINRWAKEGRDVQFTRTYAHTSPIRNYAKYEYMG